MLREGCRGTLKRETRGVPLPFGVRVVVWQERFVFATSTALCYEKLVRRGHGRVQPASRRLIRFCDIREIIGQLDKRLLLLRVHSHCQPLPAPSTLHDKVHLERFLLSTAEEVEMWATALLRLVTLAGFPCAGSVELSAPDADLDTARWADALATVR